MIDIRKFHADFKGETAFKSLNPKKYWDWMQNEYCLKCCTYHDLLRVRAEEQYQDTILAWEEFIANNPDNEQSAIGRSLIEKHPAHQRLQDMIYCPYHAKNSTAWPYEFYNMFMVGEIAFEIHKGPNQEKYMERYKKIVAEMDQKMNDFETWRDESNRMFDEIKKAYAYLKKKKTQVDDIIHNACELRKQADDAITNKDINWMRRFWDERY